MSTDGTDIGVRTGERAALRHGLAAGGAATVEEIRGRFPALQRRHNGLPVAYFDGPGGTQVPREVVDAMGDYLLNHNANTHWVYPTSVETDAAILAAREAAAEFLGGAADEVAFGQNMTTLTFHLGRALGRKWGAGDEVVVTELDHHANQAPWDALARERGITVRRVRVDAERGVIDWEALARALNPHTRLLAIGAASNALGTITDVAAAARLAKDFGALVFVDAVHYAPHALVDVGALGCDFLACSAYKFYGPHVGLLWGKRALVEALDVPKLLPAPDTAPERLETGTLSHEAIVGALAAIDFMAGLGGRSGARRQRLAAYYVAVEARSRRLLRRMHSALADIPGVRLYGTPADAPRTPTIAFTVEGVPSAEVSRALAERGVFVSNGDFYATTVVERLGRAADGLVRAGCACYTTDEEVERLVEGVADLPRRGA
ncbi:MAG TPA: cysteine desulfurase-like protein [Gemmatimonadaceae bacterium]|nr:cysteine desulfurase-like protein [Gemmatimonadaceae bacterium]